MTPTLKWLLWALALLVGVGVLDVVTFAVGASIANSLSVHAAGNVLIVLLIAYLTIGLAATASFWALGRPVAGGVRTAGTIAFLLAQGLCFAFMSLATLLGTNR